VTPTIHFDAKTRKRGEGARVPVGQPGKSGPQTTGKVTDIFHELTSCDSQITPNCLRALYGLWYDPVATKENSYGIGVYLYRTIYVSDEQNHQVEYTPGAYLQSDLDMFAKNFSTGLEGVSPILTSIDGGNFHKFFAQRATDQVLSGVIQTSEEGFDYNGESNLDLEYGMTLVTKKQPVTLYQVGDMIEGRRFDRYLYKVDRTDNQGLLSTTFLMLSMGRTAVTKVAMTPTRILSILIPPMADIRVRSTNLTITLPYPIPPCRQGLRHCQARKCHFNVLWI